MRAAAALVLLAAGCAHPPAVDPPGTNGAADHRLAEHARVLFRAALEDGRARSTLAALVAEAPHRLSGSEGAARAVAWAERELRSYGLDAVRLEPVQVPRWVRGEAQARIAGGEPLAVLALGGSVATPAEGLEAEVVMVRTHEELVALGDAARGKIVFFNRPMPRALVNTFQAYGEAVPQRTSGAIAAGRAGAVAALVRSVTTALHDHPHTGAMHYADDVPRVPAAALSTLAAERLAARVRAGPVRVWLRLACETLPDVESANVVAELRGTESPDEIVLIGAHLDAWDVGQGAHDDGAGCAHVLEAMRLLRACGIRPRRTIRAVLFMNEENGLRGARAYAAAHAGDRHVIAIETDRGGAAPRGFGTDADGELRARLQQLLEVLRPYGCGLLVPGDGGGADIAVLKPQGVPLCGLLVAPHRYFDFHHSALDVVDTIHATELALGAAALGWFAAALADEDLPQRK
jgi:hypothetical protein